MGESHQQRVIVDASVLLALVLLDEPPNVRDGAWRLWWDIIHGRVEAFVPDRFEDEVAGGLLRAIIRHRPMMMDVDWLFYQIPFFGLNWCRWRDDWHPMDVWEVAKIAQCTYVDAIYVNLALQLNATLWTADGCLLRGLVARRTTVAQLNGLQLGWIADYPTLVM